MFSEVDSRVRIEVKFVVAAVIKYWTYSSYDQDGGDKASHIYRHKQGAQEIHFSIEEIDEMEKASRPTPTEGTSFVSKSLKAGQVIVGILPDICRHLCCAYTVDVRIGMDATQRGHRRIYILIRVGARILLLFLGMEIISAFNTEKGLLGIFCLAHRTTYHFMGCIRFRPRSSTMIRSIGTLPLISLPVIFFKCTVPQFLVAFPMMGRSTDRAYNNIVSQFKLFFANRTFYSHKICQDTSSFV